MTPRHALRRGVTLVELLVVMSIMTGLLALALMLIPNINQQNAVVTGVNEVQAAIKAAQGMASATQLPHGVRFLVTNGTYTASSLQYIEMPPIIVSDPQALVAINGDTQGANSGAGPRVEITYTPYTGNPAQSPPPPINSIIGRQCIVRSLPQEVATQIVPGATLVLPTLGVWSLISGVTPQGSAYPSQRTGLTVMDISVTLQVYPDAFLGTALSYRTYQFGIYGTPVPLLAEPTVLLPAGVSADLQISYPALPTLTGLGQNYDVVFSPNGPTVPTSYPPGPLGGQPNVAGNTNVYIWIRNTTLTTNTTTGTTKPTSMYPGDFGGNYNTFMNAFRLGGDQRLVGVRAGGFVGEAPVAPPTSAGSFATYVYLPSPNGPYALAQQQLGK